MVDAGHRVVSRSQRRAMIDREEPKLSLARQCALLGISRSSLYYLPTEAGAEDMELMALIDQQYLKTPFYGSRRMTAWLSNHGHQVNRKRVRRLMQLIGLEAIYRRPNTSKPNPGHKVYPYLLRGLEINRVNQVWATDITYIPMARGFLYLVAIMDWHSRYVLAWRLSNTLEVDFCVAALEEALSKGRPQIFADIPQIEPPFLDIAPAGMLPTIISHSKGVKCVLIRSNSSFHGPTTVLPSVKSPNRLSTTKSLPWEALLPCTTR